MGLIIILGASCSLAEMYTVGLSSISHEMKRSRRKILPVKDPASKDLHSASRFHTFHDLSPVDYSGSGASEREVVGSLSNPGSV